MRDHYIVLSSSAISRTFPPKDLAEGMRTSSGSALESPRPSILSDEVLGGHVVAKSFPPFPSAVLGAD